MQEERTAPLAGERKSFQPLHPVERMLLVVHQVNIAIFERTLELIVSRPRDYQT
jgi:hypothetical protein